MIYKARLFHILGITLFVVASLIVFGATSHETSAQSVSLYNKLQEEAAQGNELARSHLLQFNAWLDENDLSFSQERKINSVETVNQVDTLIKGHEPFYLKIYNYQDFHSADQMEPYVEKRQAILATMAKQNPTREIEVSISLHEYTDISEVWSLKKRYQLDLDQMTVHLFEHDQWHSVMFVGEPDEVGEQAYIDFTASAVSFEKQLRELLPSEAFSKETPADFDFKAAWFRGKIKTLDALNLNSTSEVWLVDPISDFQDAYTKRAMEVKVVDVPHLLAIKERLENSLNRPSLSITGQPTPAPIQEVK